MKKPALLRWLGGRAFCPRWRQPAPASPACFCGFWSPLPIGIWSSKTSSSSRAGFAGQNISAPVAGGARVLPALEAAATGLAGFFFVGDGGGVAWGEGVDLGGRRSIK